MAGSKWYLSTALLILFAFNTGVASAKESIIVYANVTGDHKDINTEFRDIVVNAIDDLNKYSVKRTAAGYIAGNKPLKEKLAAADRAKVDWVADVTFSTEKRKGILDFRISRSNGENTFTWNEKFKIRNHKAFLALMEYEIPLQLKTKFLELGRIIKKESRLVYFDLGETAGIQEGHTFEVYKKGREIEDEEGNSFGYLEEITGIIRVIDVTSVYSVAEVVIGRLSIDAEDYVRRADSDIKTHGEILSVLENQIAINLGKDVGVEEGSYYAVFRDIKAINKRESFRQPIGHIKINEVYEDFAKGELSISDNFDITKYTIQRGDRIEEVESPRKDMWSVSQMMTNINADTGAKYYVGSYQRDSVANVNMSYRLRGGYAPGIKMGALGIMHSLAHSDHFFAGIDAMYIDNSTAVNAFLSVDVDTFISKRIKFNMETGFIVGHDNEVYNGVNTSLGIKYGLDLF